MTTVVVLRFVSVTPLDISTETVGGFPAVFVAAKKCFFQQEVWTSPLLFVVALRYFEQSMIKMFGVKGMHFSKKMLMLSFF